MASNGSIRFRLTAWYTVMLLAGLALFGVGTWIAVSVSVTQAVDQSLRNRVDALKRFLESVPEQELSEEVKEFAMGAPDGNLLQVRDSTGRDLLASPFAAALAHARPGF